MSSSVIFIGSPDDHLKYKSGLKVKDYTKLFLVPPKEIFFRIVASFVPPITRRYRTIYIDFIGPILGLVTLTSLLVYGYSLKKYKFGISPIEAMVLFATFMPFFCLILARLGKSNINLYESISLVGYSLYGHLLTLLVSFIFFHEDSNVFFFVCLVVFGGFSTLRLILVFLKTIPVPGARFLVCTSISLVNMLFLIYLHVVFMHRTFNFKEK